jgi:hypothetical protein
MTDDILRQIGVNEHAISKASDRAVRPLLEERERLRAEARRRFARLNGWREANRGFSLVVLRDHKVRDAAGFDYGLSGSSAHGFDHLSFYRDAHRPYRAAAIVAHNYASDAMVDKARAFAAERGLVAHTPPDTSASWYLPGGVRFICYTRPGIAVVWLPEQTGTYWDAEGEGGWEKSAA